MTPNIPVFGLPDPARLVLYLLTSLQECIKINIVLSTSTIQFLALFRNSSFTLLSRLAEKKCKRLSESRQYWTLVGISRKLTQTAWHVKKTGLSLLLWPQPRLRADSGASAEHRPNVRL